MRATVAPGAEAGTRGQGRRGDLPPQVIFAALAALAALGTTAAGAGFKSALTTAPPPPSRLAAAWRTPVEACDYQCTPRYDETMAYLRRIEAASRFVKVTSYGKSAQGRDLPLVIVSNRSTFTPAAARARGLPIVLVQNAIHGGEMDGKDASLALLRDLTVTPIHAKLLDGVTLLILPIYNVDGHERFGPTHRINQAGPSSTGFRTNAQGLDLNRDYMKLDTAEARAWTQNLYTQWWPELFVDTHVTDGADFQYDLTYLHEQPPHSNVAVNAWLGKNLMPLVLDRLRRGGHKLAPYVLMKDNLRLEAGTYLEPNRPRFGVTYVTLHNRAGLLIESHARKDFETRVTGTYDFLVAILQGLLEDRGRLVRLVRDETEREVTAARSYRPEERVPIGFDIVPGSSRPFFFEGYEMTIEKSPVSGADVGRFSRVPKNSTIPFFNEAVAVKSVARPLGYLIPPEYGGLADRLRVHGLELATLAEPIEAEFELYRLTQWKFPEKSYQGRSVPTFVTTAVREKRRFPAGSLYVSLAQAGARVAMGLLEPEAPDSFASWGFFNGLAEQKEWYDDDILEPMARAMLAADPQLRKEFEAKLAADAGFAANPAARLDFFYERTQYADRDRFLYPIARVTAPLGVATTVQP